MLYSVTYVSSANAEFNEIALQELLQKARHNNARDGLTGMLLFKGGNFMQVLEGEEQIVRNRFRIIANDPRHKGALALLQGPIPARSFTDWSMGFQHLSTADASIPGYSQFLNTPLTSPAFADQPSQAKKLLLMFRQKM